VYPLIDTSISRSVQLDCAIPASKISALSSGQFVGMVADDPAQKIKLKMFHAEVLNDAHRLERETKTFLPIPNVSEVTTEIVFENYHQIRLDIKRLIEYEVGKLKSK
jgi:hypothetical protein